MSRWINNNTRLAIYLRDGMSCAYCGSTVEDGAQLSLDHLQPRSKASSKSGLNDPSNLVTCCRKCNSSRGNRPVKEFAAKAAGYINHGVTTQDIMKHIRNCRNRQLPINEARKINERRGSAFKAVNSSSDFS